MDDQDQTAAIKLSQNLIAKFEPDDALQFAAMVMARLCHDARLPLHKGLELTMTTWMQMALDYQSPSGFVNCQCGASTEAVSADTGLTITHSGIACPGFRSRFANNPRVRAADHAGWSNEQIDSAQIKSTVDDASVRFGLIEFK